MNLEHAHKTRFWYLLGVFLNYSDEHPGYFFGGSILPFRLGAPNYKSNALNTQPSAPVSLTGQGISCQGSSDCKVEETTGNFSLSF